MDFLICFIVHIIIITLLTMGLKTTNSKRMFKVCYFTLTLIVPIPLMKLIIFLNNENLNPSLYKRWIEIKTYKYSELKIKNV